jgi:hypothetical protein
MCQVLDFREASMSVTEAIKSVTEASNFVKALKDEHRKWKNQDLDSAKAELEKRQVALKNARDVLEKRDALSIGIIN